MNLACVGDLKRFYSTPVDSMTPYEALRKVDLPKNLHIQQDYHRFHPGETSREIYTIAALFLQRRTDERLNGDNFLFSLARHRHDVQRQNGVPEKLHPRHWSQVQEEISRTYAGGSMAGRADEDLSDDHCCKLRKQLRKFVSCKKQ